MRDEENSPFVVYADVLTEEEIEWFDDFIPCGNEFGCHSIKSIVVRPIATERIIL